MAAVEVTITGVLYDKLARTTQQVVLIGDATLTGLGVGGGPIQPPGQPPGGGGGGQPPHPAFPIWGGPGAGFPDKPGYPPVVGGGPVVPPEGPPDGGQPPTDGTTPGGDKPPPQGQAGWGYVAQWDDGTPGGWGYFPGPGEAGPKG